ncbi:MAG TPA: hypothetical protein VGM08_03475 [Candidatus Saccharimonadales bacterium]|jgi:hypothetical protein
MQKFGTLLSLTLISVAVVFVLATHKAAAAPEYCFMLGDPTNGSTANDACLAGQTAPPELQGLSSGMSSSALQSTFINDVKAYATKPYPVDKVGVAYIVAQLQQQGGNWETNLGLTTLTVEDSSVAGCANTAYDPTSNSVVHISDCPTGPALIARQNGKIVFAIRIDCGNVLGNFPGPQPNVPPVGSISAAQCNAASDTYTIRATFSDANGTTQARLIGKDGKQYGGTATSPGTTWTLQTASTPRTAFPMTFEVADVEGGKILAWDAKGTLSLTGAMNCQPVDDITAVSCHAVSVKLWDPNAPTANIQFKVGLNGGAPEGGGTFSGGKNGGNVTYNLAGLSDFDPWINDKVVLYGVDADSGAAVQVGSVTLSGNVCDSLQCGTSSLAGTGLVAKEPTSFDVTEKIVAPGDAPNLGNIGPKNAHFAVQIGPGSALNETRSYETPVSASTLESTPVDVFTPPSSGNFNLSWQLAGGEAPGGPSCGKAVQAGYEPFFTVEGGDIAAGPGFGAGCTEQGTPAGITAYNLDNPAFGAYSYFGAGSQLGAFANGGVTHFVTDSSNIQSSNKSVSTNGLTIPPYASPTGLSFSNSSAASTTYGGGFDRSAGWCVPDYAGQAVANASGSPDYSTPGTRTYTLPANSTIGNITVQPGARVTLVATGNVYINGNITYNESYTVAGGDITQVPQFTLLIKGGNLYVNNTVATLNGFYDVQPTGNSGGTLYSCASGLGADYGQNYDACNHPLTFYGAVSATKLKLERTYGSLVSASGAPNVPSERFVYTPEMWLGNLVGPSCRNDPTSLGCLYQAYTALPPVL